MNDRQRIELVKKNHKNLHPELAKKIVQEEKPEDKSQVVDDGVTVEVADDTGKKKK